MDEPLFGTAKGYTYADPRTTGPPHGALSWEEREEVGIGIQELGSVIR